MKRNIVIGLTLFAVIGVIGVLIGKGYLIRTQGERKYPKPTLVAERSGLESITQGPTRSVRETEPRLDEQNKASRKKETAYVSKSQKGPQEDTDDLSEFEEIPPYEMNEEIPDDFYAQQNANRPEITEYLLNEIKYAMELEGVSEGDVENMTQDFLVHIATEEDLETTQEQQELRSDLELEDEIITSLMDDDVSPEDMENLLEDLMMRPDELGAEELEAEELGPEEA